MQKELTNTPLFLPPMSGFSHAPGSVQAPGDRCASEQMRQRSSPLGGLQRRERGSNSECSKVTHETVTNAVGKTRRRENSGGLTMQGRAETAPRNLTNDERVRRDTGLLRGSSLHPQ